MCELILYFGGAVTVGLMLWVVLLDGELDDYKQGIKSPPSDYTVYQSPPGDRLK